ncbi:hypothetical protein DFH05DRAFT_1533776 [Lentinula detonsa]|uniref:PAS domain-containing protein n=1 Tax=Lentinula detonsa TaxID=2804962 RepID=A0A9W8P674_9AGAR|nr:hypothetical protein DFH05DRAFT_1533776 [Lentinula detonsa]
MVFSKGRFLLPLSLSLISTSISTALIHGRCSLCFLQGIYLFILHNSFILINQLSAQANWIYTTSSVSDLLGYEPHELRGRPSLELVHPDEMERVRKLHYDTIKQDKAACLVYIRMKHKDPNKGYILCGVSRTIVHNITVGSVSYANSGAKALHNASTAQEITVISPTPELEFRRWHDPSPMPPNPVPAQLRKPFDDNLDETSPEPEELFTYDPLPSQSFRTAFILDRFSLRCPIQYCSNSLLITANNIEDRSFFDFVASKDEPTLRSWIATVKGWGVNERGQPSDGGFGFGKFTLLAEGRDSLAGHRSIEPTSARHRHGSGQASRTRQGRSSVRGHGSDTSTLSTRTVPLPESESFTVDAIFSAHSDGLIVILRRGT